MVAIHTSEDIIRALRDDPELLDQVRRAVMTDEVLALPRQFSEMQKTQNEMLKTQNEMLKTQNKLLEGQSEIREDIRALHRMYRRQHDDLGRFRGNYAGDAGRRSGPEIAHLFARLHDLRRIFVRPLSIEERGEAMGRASEVEDLNVRERAWITFQTPDYTAMVSDLMNRGVPLYYIVMEASYTGSSEDVLRATDHAKIIRRASGLDAYPAVAAVRVAPSIESSVFYDVDEFIEANDEDAVLLYQLDEEDLEPLDVC